MFPEMENVPVKNTFIHFPFQGHVHAHDGHRCTSAPPCSNARSGCSNSRNTSICDEKNGITTTGNRQNQYHGVGHSSETCGKRHGRRRPNKALRKDFRQYVDNLKEEFRESPWTFSWDNIDIPRQFVRPGAKEKIAKILEDTFKNDCFSVSCIPHLNKHADTHSF